MPSAASVAAHLTWLQALEAVLYLIHALGRVGHVGLSLMLPFQLFLQGMANQHDGALSVKNLEPIPNRLEE